MASGNILIDEYVITGTHQGEWAGAPATGKPIEVPHLNIVEFEGDKVKKMTTYLDLVTGFVQVGLLPPGELPPLEPSFTLPDPEPTGLSPLEAVANINARWDAHDLALFAQGIHADAELLIAALGLTLNRESFIAMQELYFLAFSDLRSELVRMIDMGDGWVLGEAVFRGTNDGPYFGIPATGRTVEQRGAWIYRLESGLLTITHYYFDNLIVFVQLGLVEPTRPTTVSPASWGEIKAKFR